MALQERQHRSLPHSDHRELLTLSSALVLGIEYFRERVSSWPWVWLENFDVLALVLNVKILALSLAPASNERSPVLMQSQVSWTSSLWTSVTHVCHKLTSVMRMLAIFNFGTTVYAVAYNHTRSYLGNKMWLINGNNTLNIARLFDLFLTIVK